MNTNRNEIQYISLAYAISYQGVILRKLISKKINGEVVKKFRCLKIYYFKLIVFV